MTEEKCIVCGSSKDRHGDVFACRDFRSGDWQKEHVEPSAAESDVEWETRIANAAESAAGIDLIPKQSTSAYTLHRQAEARMLELAQWGSTGSLDALRKLVIETLGDKP